MIEIDYNIIKTRKELDRFFKEKYSNFSVLNKKLISGETILQINRNKVITNQGEFIINKLEIYDKNPITEQFENIRIKKVITEGFYLHQSIYKKIYYKTEEYKNKLKETHIKNFGSQENYIRHWKKEVTKTNKKKYGVKWFLQRGEHYKKIDDVMLERYGAKTPIQNEQIRQKITDSIKERYGVDWFFVRGIHYEKVENVMLERYGVKNNFQQIQNSTGRVSNLEREIVDRIIKEFNVNLNNVFCYKTKQKRVDIETTWYNIDFYDPDRQLVIEINGDLWHCNPKIYASDYFHKGYNLSASEIWEKDRIRKEEIISKLNCKFIEIWEQDWKKDKNKVIETLKEYFLHDKNNEEAI